MLRALGGAMQHDLRSMSIDELWHLYEKLADHLKGKITDEQAKLEELLRKIEPGSDVTPFRRERRPYPKVLPKYQNPKNPIETWSGRGKLPRWLDAQLKAGKRLDQFLITRSSSESRGGS